MTAGSAAGAASAGVDDANAVLLTDLYELTMLEAYFATGRSATAVFDLYVRDLPPQRNFLIACGLDDALRYLEQLRFAPQAIERLAGLERFSRRFLDALSTLRFTGDVYAVPEGTPVFGGEPIIEVVAPLPEAQLVETYLLNQVHFQTVIASKGARVVDAAAGRSVVDFGARRAHGTDAAMKAARALSIAGFNGTSNVLAAQTYGIPAAGTMAHSYIQTYGNDLDAFRAFVATHPETTLLVDTYDTMAGVDAVVRLARELGDAFRVNGVRLDSGDLDALSRATRQRLDAAGLQQVSIFVSGGLDEHDVARLVAADAPVDGFGVGTRVIVAADAPSLDAVYKLVSYDGRDSVKRSPGKATLPGRKQLFRRYEGGEAAADLIAGAEESHDGEPLLRPVMADGQRLPEGEESLSVVRERARREVGRLPARMRALEPDSPRYPVAISPALAARADLAGRAGRSA